MAQDGKDSAGVVLAVGNTVNLVGTVTAINLVDNHYKDILVTLTHPLTPGPTGGANAVFSGPPKGMEGADTPLPGPVTQIAVHSSLLTKV